MCLRKVLNMKKEELIALGLEETLAEKVAAASTDELKGFVPKIRFDEVNIAKKNAEALVLERNGQLETLKNSSGDSETLKAEIIALQNANKLKDDAHSAEIKQLRIDSAVTAALNTVKAKNQKAVKALLELTDAEISDDGTIKGLDAQLKKLTEADDSKFLFDAVTKPKLKGAKLGEEGVEGEDGKADPSKMSYTELCAHLAENPDTIL